MKKILIIFILFCNAEKTFCQDSLLSILPMKDGKVYYIKILSIDSINKTQLFLRAKKWFVQTYTSANDVIQMEDKESGQIIGKGLMKESYHESLMRDYEASVYHTAKVTVKDEKVKIEITDFKMNYLSQEGNFWNKIDMPLEDFCKTRPENKKKFLIKVQSHIAATLTGFKKFILETHSENDKW